MDVVARRLPSPLLETAAGKADRRLERVLGGAGAGCCASRSRAGMEMMMTAAAARMVARRSGRRGCLPSHTGPGEWCAGGAPQTLVIIKQGIQPQIYSCSRNGEICLMDMEEEIFNMVYLCNDLVLSLCQSPDNSNCLYFGKGNGDLNAFDVRAGKISSIWQLHCDSISSIDFNPENTHMLATSSLDKTACVWDVRNMKMQKAQSLKVVEHKMRVHSAYFSPSGSILATTSHDNIGILSACDFDRSSYLQHWSPSTTFKASWGWSDSELFVGTERDIDILSVDISDNGISTSHKARIGSEHMADVPSQFATHPYQVGVLACAGHRNKLFLWTPQ